jgi:DNA repair protein RadC
VEGDGAAVAVRAGMQLEHEDAEERPRERVWRSGVQAVADEELLALLVGSGVRDRPARAVATALVSEVGGVAALSRATPRELAQVTGIGAARAAIVAAAFELGRRALAARDRRVTLGSAADVARVLQPRVAGLQQEVFFVLAIDIRNGLVEVIEVARGTVHGVEVHPREVFRPLLRMAAAAGVVAHNHPSGDPRPSAEDIALTRRLREVGLLVGIPIVDHVVLGGGSHTSIAEYVGTEL